MECNTDITESNALNFFTALFNTETDTVFTIP